MNSRAIRSSAFTTSRTGPRRSDRSPDRRWLKLKVAHSVETATFQVKPGVTDVALLAVEARVRAGRISSWPGYLGRELAKDDATGEWLMVMRFERREQMDAWMSEVKGVPEMRELGALIEMKTMVTRFFTHAEP